jgi:hypothetical protein
LCCEKEKLYYYGCSVERCKEYMRNEKEAEYSESAVTVCRLRLYLHAFRMQALNSTCYLSTLIVLLVAASSQWHVVLLLCAVNCIQRSYIFLL